MAPHSTTLHCPYTFAGYECRNVAALVWLVSCNFAFYVLIFVLLNTDYQNVSKYCVAGLTDR
jgi:hypothetical protein